MEHTIVIENDKAFSFHLGVPSSAPKTIGTAMLAGLGGFALVAFVLSNPIGIALGAGIVASGGVTALSKLAPKMTQHGKKLFRTPLDRLGDNVSSLVFFPVLGMAFSDGKFSNMEMEFIKDEMKDWGYAEQYIETFIREKTNRLTEIFELENMNLLSQEFANNKKNALDQNMGIKLNDVAFADLRTKAIKLCENICKEKGSISISNQKYLEYLKGQI